jgi:hypothetical protein
VSPIAFVLGIDPGPSTGIGLLRRDGRARAFQCDAGAAAWLLTAVCADAVLAGRGAAGIEGFAPGNGPGAVMRAGRLTRDQVRQLEAVAAGWGIPVTARYMAHVRPWASDERLRRAGLYELTAGGAHCRAAMRHALFCAVHDCGWPDPVGREGRSYTAAPGGRGDDGQS